MNGADFIAQLPEKARQNDSSKIGDKLTCLRFYFYSHLLGLRPEAPEIDLVFGDAGHKAKEHLRANGGYENPVVLDEALDIFEKVYEKSFPDPDQDTENGLKHKDKKSFRVALTEHVRRYKGERQEWEYLLLERPFEVPVDSAGLHYYGRMDAVVEGPERTFDPTSKSDVRKIAPVDDKFSRFDSDGWLEQWYLSFQVRGYLYAVLSHAQLENSLWPPDQIWGMLIDGTILKPEPRFKQDGTPYANQRELQYDEFGIPYRHRHEVVSIPLNLLSVESWIFEVNYHIGEIAHNFDLLSSVKESDPVMLAFPRCPKCLHFAKPCRFFSICHATENPLQIANQIPTGFKREFWSPLDRMKEKGQE